MTNEAVQQAVLEKLNLLETGLNGVKSELGEEQRPIAVSAYA
ncbi:MAG: hypothetical protein Q8O06_02925 [Acetobacterium sp.]|nr:hypothetical protein [Acetobacterium sp.]